MNAFEDRRENVPYAMAYVKVQEWEKPMCAEEALESGTAFGCLVMPFTGKKVEE